MATAWDFKVTELDRGTRRWGPVGIPARAPSFQEVIRSWSSAGQFREFWRSRLANLPFDAYCWECPPVTEESVQRPFECVFVSSPELAHLTPDPGAFAEHFRPDCGVATFGNLGGDAVLVAPAPGPEGTNYSHLASFTATAPAAQQDALWQAVGEAMTKRIGPSPVWLSTAGLGIAWLHVRLDSRPKYYRHAPYRNG